MVNIYDIERAYAKHLEEVGIRRKVVVDAKGAKKGAKGAKGATDAKGEEVIKEIKLGRRRMGVEGGDFKAGDTVKVHVRIVEGDRDRIQIFEGVCIACRHRGLNSSFTVRKISYGEGMERVFPLYSPNVAKIEVVRRGDVRRAKLHYLRGLTGKKARIKSKRDLNRDVLLVGDGAEEQMPTPEDMPEDINGDVDKDKVS